MKKNATPELMTEWWRANQPQGLSSAKTLEDALKAYETALKRLEKSGSADDCKECVKAIEALAAAANKVKAETQKALDSRPDDDVAGALATAADKAYGQAQKALKSRAKDDMLDALEAAADKLQSEAKGLSAGGKKDKLDALARAADHLQGEAQKALKARSKDDKLKTLVTAAEKLQAEIQAAVKSASRNSAFDAQDYENTHDAMDKLFSKLAEARDEAEDLRDEDEGLFGNAEKYQIYLRKWLTKARNAPLTFAFVAGATSAEHRMMLHRSKDPAALLTKLKNETKLKKGIFGMAGAHPEQNATLVLELYTKPLPGLPKKFRLLLKRFKPLPFDRVLMTMEGNAVQDVPDPEDTEPEEIEGVQQPAAAAQGRASSEADIPPAPPIEDLIATELMAKFKGLTTALNKVLAADPRARDEILGLIERFKAQHKESRLDDAGVTLKELQALLKPARASAAEPQASANPQGAVAYGKARLAWLQARTVARNEIDRLAKKIVEDSRGEPDSAQIEAGCENLYEMLDELDERLADELDAALNAQSEDERLRLHAQAQKTLDEYRAYVDSDELLKEIDDNAFVAVRVRRTMAAALTAIGNTLS